MMLIMHEFYLAILFVFSLHLQQTKINDLE